MRLIKNETLRFSRVESGFSRGSLIEVSGAPGAGKTEAVLQCLAENPTARIAWVEENLTAYPCAFPQKKVGLNRVLFVDANPQNSLWTVHQLLRSNLFSVVVLTRASEKALDEIALRRLQLAAEKSQANVFLIADAPTEAGAWPIAAQLQVSRAARSGEVQIQVLKHRGQSSWQLFQLESLA